MSARKVLQVAAMASFLLLPSVGVVAENEYEPRKTFSNECYPEDELFCAIGQHDNKKVKELLEHGASATALGFKRGYKGDRPEYVAELQREDYPLQFAIQYGNFFAVDQLLAHGANPDGEVIFVKGFPPLGEAANLGELGIVQLLLAHGADPNKRSKIPGEDPPVFLAVLGPDGDNIEGPRSSEIQIRIVDALVEAGANVNATVGNADALDQAAFVADSSLLSRLFEIGAKPACLTEDFDNFNTDWTLLQWSVMSRDPKMVQKVASIAPYYCVGSAKGGFLAVKSEAHRAKNYKENYSEVMDRLGKIKIIIGKMKAPKQQ